MVKGKEEMTESRRRPWWRVSFRLSARSIALTPVLILFSIGLFLWLPTTGTLLIIGCLWFRTTAYYLGALTEQFNLRCESILTSALLMLILSLLSYISALWYYFPNAENGRLVMMLIITSFWLPSCLLDAYSLLRAYREAP